MASDSRIRAADADREQTAAALREHLAVGRLTTAEFEERLDRAHAAKTLGELDDLMADLPGVDLEQLPDAPLQRVGAGPPLPRRRLDGAIEARQGRFSLAWRAAWGTWLAISVLLLVIWLVTGTSGSLWFLWIVLPLGALLLGRWIMGASTRG